MNRNYWSDWLKAASVRALKTFAQAAIAAIPLQVSIDEVAWTHVLGVAALSAVLSLLTSIAGLPEVEKEEQ